MGARVVDIRPLLQFLGGTFLVVLILAASAQARAQANLQASDQVPATLPGVRVVSVADVRPLLGKVILADARILHDYLAGHLPGALHIPYKEASARSPDFNPAQDDVPAFLARLQKFIPERDTQLVFYCNAPSCWKSYKAAKVAVGAGYSQVLWLREGLVAWRAEGLELVRE